MVAKIINDIVNNADQRKSAELMPLEKHLIVSSMLWASIRLQRDVLLLYTGIKPEEEGQFQNKELPTI